MSEKIYFQHFFKDEIHQKKLRILPLGGNTKVTKIYDYLKLHMSEDTKNIRGKVYCIIDTDKVRHRDDIKDCPVPQLKIARLFNNENIETKLISLASIQTGLTDIEQSLNPIIFQETMQALAVNEDFKIEKIINENGNTDFIKNFENYKIQDYFKENKGENKLIFARKYIEILKEKENQELFVMPWIKEIKNWFQL